MLKGVGEHGLGPLAVVADPPQLHIEEGRLQLDHLAVVNERGAVQGGVLGGANFKGHRGVHGAASIEPFTDVAIHRVIFPVGLAGPHAGLRSEGSAQLGIDRPTLDQGVLGHSTDRDAQAIAKHEIVVELVLQDFGDVGPEHEAAEALQHASVLSLREAGPDDADRAGGVAANAYAGPPVMQRSLDVHGATATRWPIVEEPAKLRWVEIGLQVAVRKLQGGRGALFPRTLEIKAEEGVAGEFAENVSGVKGGQAFAAVEGRRRAFEVRDEEGAPPVADLGRGAHCGPKRGIAQEHAKMRIEAGDVAGQLSQAVLDLGPLPIKNADLIERWAVLANVSNQASLAVDPRFVAHDVGQELAGGADERAPVVLLILARSLANDGDPVIDAVDDHRVLVGNEPGEVGDHQRKRVGENCPPPVCCWREVARLRPAPGRRGRSGWRCRCRHNPIFWT